MEDTWYKTTILLTRREDTSYLPTHRQNLRSHPSVSTALLHSSAPDQKVLPPQWTRVSRTQWKDKADLCGGYGQIMKRNKVSSDAPDVFKQSDPERKGFDIEKKRRSNQQFESVLPGGSSLLETIANTKSLHSDYASRKKNHRLLNFKNQTLLYPPLTVRQPQKIDWDRSRPQTSA